MSFTFQVSGHAGDGVRPTDEDEGEKVKAFISRLLVDANASHLNVAVHNVSPDRWAPVKLNSFPSV